MLKNFIRKKISSHIVVNRIVFVSNLFVIFMSIVLEKSCMLILILGNKFPLSCWHQCIAYLSLNGFCLSQIFSFDKSLKEIMEGVIYNKLSLSYLLITLYFSLPNPTTILNEWQLHMYFLSYLYFSSSGLCSLQMSILILEC